MRHALKMLLYRIGRRLMHLNYVPGVNAVEHDLRVEVQELRRKVGQLEAKR